MFPFWHLLAPLGGVPHETVLTLHSVLATVDELPRFWVFMYRVNPFTYVLEGFLGISLAAAPIHCANNELLRFSPPPDLTCDEYMEPYMAAAGGTLVGGSGPGCEFCAMESTDTFLKGLNISFGNRWRDFGFMWAYCVFNIAAAVGLYWLARVPKGKNTKMKKQ